MSEQPGDQPPAMEGPKDGPKDGPDFSSGISGMSRLWRRTAGTAAVVAVLVVGNATAAGASTRAGHTPVPTAADNPSPATDVSGAALHGEFRVINRDGSAQLRRWQSGAVNALDKISMTVRSADGFDSTYLLGPGVSVTGIGVGDEVTVVGAGQAVRPSPQ